MNRTRLRDMALGKADIGNLLLEYDEYENYLAWLEENGTENTDSAGQKYYLEGDAETDYRDFIKTLSDECEERGLFSQLCQIEGRNVNWMGTGGIRDEHIGDVEDLLKYITPSGDWTMRVYEYYDGLSFVVLHHDCPTGSRYYVTPIEHSACTRCDTVYHDEKILAFIAKWDACPECAQESAWIIMNGTPYAAQDFMMPFTRYKARDLLVDMLYANGHLDGEEEELAEWKKEEADQCQCLT